MSFAAALDGPRFGPARAGKPKQLVVLLHGWGADGNDLIGLAPALAPVLPDAEFPSPDGPFECVAQIAVGQPSPLLPQRDLGFARHRIGQSDPNRADAIADHGKTARHAEELRDPFAGELAPAVGVDGGRSDILVEAHPGTVMAFHHEFRAGEDDPPHAAARGWRPRVT